MEENVEVTPKRKVGRPKGSKKLMVPADGSVPASPEVTAILARLTEIMSQQTAIAGAQLKNAPKRRKTLKEYVAEKAARGLVKQLVRPSYQNNRLINASMLSREHLALLDRLAPGAYGGGIITVRRVGEAPNNIIVLHYSNSNEAQRMNFAIWAKGSLGGAIENIAAEMEKNGVPYVDEVAPPAPSDEDESEDDQSASPAFDASAQKNAVYDAMRAAR